MPDIRLTVDGAPHTVPAGSTAGEAFAAASVSDTIAVRINELAPLRALAPVPRERRRGAVSVRPTRLPRPVSSVKRYQYSVAGDRPPTSTRQGQSAAARIGARIAATTSRNPGSRATSARRS